MFIQHSDVDRPGLLGETLGGMGLPLEIIRPDLGQMVPDSLDGFAGLALGGGPQGAYEQGKYPYLSNECALVRSAASQGKPVIGLCLGAQLMASALGARVQPGHREVGFFEVTLDPISQYDPLWRGVPAKFVATPNVPVPVPKRTLTVLLVSLATTESSFVSPSKSASATDVLLSPVAVVGVCTKVP